MVNQVCVRTQQPNFQVSASNAKPITEQQLRCALESISIDASTRPGWGKPKPVETPWDKPWGKPTATEDVSSLFHMLSFGIGWGKPSSRDIGWGKPSNRDIGWGKPSSRDIGWGKPSSRDIGWGKPGVVETPWGKPLSSPDIGWGKPEGIKA